MNDLQVKSIIIFVELALILTPALLVFALYAIRKRMGSGFYTVLKALFASVYALGTSYVVYWIGDYYNVSPLALWMAVSMSVLLGMEFLHLHLFILKKKGSELAIKLLEI